MFRALSAALAAIAAVPAAAQIGLPQDVTEGMYVTLEEVRRNSAATFGAFAGPQGGPIPKETFVTRDIPRDIVRSQPDRELLSKLFEQLDANGDDMLTRAEWNRRIESDLAFADQNEDGRITLKELANARENMSFGDASGLVF